MRDHPLPNDAGSRPLDPALRFDTTPYERPWALSIVGVFCALVFGIGAAIGIGWCFSALRQWFYLGLVFPAVIGVGASIGTMLGIYLGRLRHPPLAGLVGFSVGVFAYLAMHYFDFVRVEGKLETQARTALCAKLDDLVKTLNLIRVVQRQNPGKVGDQLKNQLGDIRNKVLLDDCDEDVQPVVRRWLRESEPVFLEAIQTQGKALKPDEEVEQFLRPRLEAFGPMEYVEARATQGVVLPRLPKLLRNPWNLAYYGSFIFWSIEALIAGAVGAAMAVLMALEPYCTECGAWKEQNKLGQLDLPTQEAVRIVTQGEIVRLADFPMGTGKLRLKVAYCPTCKFAGLVDLTLEEIPLKKLDEPTVHARCTYPGAALRVLEEVFQKKVISAEATNTDEI